MSILINISNKPLIPRNVIYFANPINKLILNDNIFTELQIHINSSPDLSLNTFTTNSVLLNCYSGDWMGFGIDVLWNLTSIFPNKAI